MGLGESTNSSSNCPNLFEEIGTCCYYFSADHTITNQETSWNDAESACQDLGELYGLNIHLAEVETTAGCDCDNALLEAVRIKGVPTTWFGATDAVSEGRWVWSHTNEWFPLTSTRWSIDEPYDEEKGDCLTAGV